MTTADPARGVCVVGSINIDTTYRVPHIPLPGETLLAQGRTGSQGGKGANQAAAAARLGSQVTFIGCTGEDADGVRATASLRRLGVDVTQVRALPGASTGTALVLVSADGENVVVVDAGANQRMDPVVVAEGVSSGAHRVVLAQLEINLDAVVSAATSSGPATFVLNPAPMTARPELLIPVLECTDILVPNRLELARLAGCEAPTDQAALDSCVARLDFAGAVLVTLGSAGVAVYPAGRPRPVTLIDPVHVATVDTTGAGDAFCGALGHFLAESDDLAAAARRANEVAALSTTVRGARIG